MKSSLSQHRKEASDLSLGSSHQMIYQKAISLLPDREGGNHLDYGAGQGNFIELVAGQFPGWNLSALDLMEKPARLSESIHWYSEDLNGETHLADESFDSISALEIIEHLENPRHVFRVLFRLLKKSGVLILSTPNNESLRSILSFWRRGHFVDFTDRSYPAHITPLNRKDLERAAKEAGFSNLNWEYIEKGCLPGLTQLSWQSVSLGVLKGLRYSDNIFMILKK